MNAIKFYIMPEQAVSGSDRFLDIVCEIIARHYHLGERIFVLAADQSQAESLDERLWQFDADEFVAHNLVGEGPKSGAPVEIGWESPRERRTTLIHLKDDVMNASGRYQKIIDFVPADELGKQQARERYKVYRRLGLTPETEPY